MDVFINPWKLFHGAFIPNWLLKRREVSWAAKVMYARLAQYAGEDGSCFPTQAELSEEMGASERQVRDYVAELAKHGLIKSMRSGLGKSNRYFFLAHEWMEIGHFDRNDCSGEKSPIRAARTRLSDRREVAAPYNKDLRESYKENHIVGFTPPSPAEIVAYGQEIGLAQEHCDHFRDHFESNGWKVGGKTKMRDWKAALRNWRRNQTVFQREGKHCKPEPATIVRRKLSSEARAANLGRIE